MKALVWKRQDKEGMSMCYAKGYENCSEEGCAFWNSCLERTIKDWEEKNNVKTNYENGVEPI